MTMIAFRFNSKFYHLIFNFLCFFIIVDVLMFRKLVDFVKLYIKLSDFKNSLSKIESYLFTSIITDVILTFNINYNYNQYKKLDNFHF